MRITHPTRSKKSQMSLISLIKSLSKSILLSSRLAARLRIRILHLKLSLGRNSLKLGTSKTMVIAAGLKE